MLIFPLKKEWYEKIKSGEKTIEYRESRQNPLLQLGVLQIVYLLRREPL